MIRRALSVAVAAPELAGGALLLSAGLAFAAPQTFTASADPRRFVAAGSVT
jgi:hypothetical protein